MMGVGFWGASTWPEMIAIMLVFWVVLGLFLVWAVSSHRGGGLYLHEQHPERVLAERLARGEITVEEYTRDLELLHRARS
jgi:uncharacterized membrane protein